MAGAAEAMNKAKVIRLLEFFPDIDEEIRAKRSAITDLDQYYNTVSGIQYDGMPKGNYHTGSMTEYRAMNIPDYISKEIKAYKKEIEILQKVKVEIIKEVSRLKLRHKKIIFGFYFNCMKWEQVAERTNYSDRQCKNIRDEALGKLLDGFKKNKVLTEYNK
jgi:hypothetical protein